MFCLHKWDKWSDPIDTMQDFAKVQSRRCEKCGLVEVAKVKQPFNKWFMAETICAALDKVKGGA